MRKLASIQKIESVKPIENSDSLDVARVLGWNVVVKRGEFEAGDLCVYVECDAVLPDRPEFEFMKKRGFRVKTIKLRGQISQGICFPLLILPSGWWKDGDDVTEILGVTKYDPEVYAKNGLGAAYVSCFPSFLIKTDEVRIQSMPQLLKDFKGTLCYVTEKLDGSSFTAYVNEEGKVGICSRNLEVKQVPENDGNIFYEIAKQNDFLAKMGKLGPGLVVQGEVIGPKIQGNRYGLKKQELRIFSVYNMWKRQYFDLDSLSIIATALETQIVPVVKDTLKLPGTVDELVNLSIGASALKNDIPREGIVVRSWMHIPEPHKEVRELSFKVINPEYLLYFDS